jgi:hypothetical protein
MHTPQVVYIVLSATMNGVKGEIKRRLSYTKREL